MVGSISSLYDPVYWKFEKVGKYKCSDENVVRVVIGEMDDYETCDIKVLMLESHFWNCVNKKWRVKGYPYSEKKIALFDENEKEVEVINNVLY